MPTVLPQDAIDAADAAVVFAQLVRKQHRRRTEKNAPQRKRDLDMALKRLREAMKPLKSEIGRFPYGPQTTPAERNRQLIKEKSAAVQRERRKLWKMQDKITKKPKED